MQPSRDCVQKTLKRLEERIQGRVLRQILYSLSSSNPLLQQRTAVALARLAREQDLRTIFVDCKGMDVLLNILVDSSKTSEQQKEAAGTDSAIPDWAEVLHLVCSDCAQGLYVLPFLGPVNIISSHSLRR